ncbi:MAG: MBL fold metallo-hydrolase [Ignavibacteriales bacterium]|nr:MBL fold metallo-hydrolase [Ignavibacteriales bacterium]
MKIKFLGTGSGQTSLNRFHSSFLISSSEHNLLVDCGDGISKAILKQNVNFNSIDSILISHFHADHFSGLPSLLTQMKLLSRKNDLTIFVHSSEKDFLEDFIFHSYLFKERITFDLKMISFDVEIEIKVSEKFCFVSKLNSHLDKYKKYDSEYKLGFTSLSFYFKDDENSVIYSGDVGSENDLYLFDQKVDWFITETTHIKKENVLELLEKSDPKEIILTHIGDDFAKPLNEFRQSLPNHIKSRIILAFDGFELNQYHSGCL